jgi:hypothetical protein
VLVFWTLLAQFDTDGVLIQLQVKLKMFSEAKVGKFE